MRDGGDAGDFFHARLVRLRQELDERNLVAHDEPVGAGELDAADERLLDRAEQAEEHERHKNRQQRERGAEFFPLQISPDEVGEFHGRKRAVETWSANGASHFRPGATPQETIGEFVEG